MFYVYTLSYNKRVVYIGFTKNPESRLLNHVTGGTQSTYWYISLASKKYSKPPTLKIIYSSTDKYEALNFEYKKIRKFAAAGIPLLNICGNIESNTISKNNLFL